MTALAAEVDERLEQDAPAARERLVGPTLVVAGLCLTVFSGNWAEMGLPPLDRPLLCAGLLWAWVGLDGPAVRRRYRWRPVHWVLVASTAYVVVSALIAGTITDKSSLLGIVDTYGVLPYLIFASAPLLFATCRQRRVLLIGLVVLGGYLAAVAILEVAGPHALVVPHYIVSKSITIQQGRARGPFTESVVNGVALLACAAAALIAASRWRGAGRIAAITVAAGSLAGTFLTLTRSVWIATLLAIAVAAAAEPRLRRLALPAALMVPLALVTTLAFAPSLRESTSHRLNDQVSVWDRRNMDAAAARVYLSHPVLGVGWHRFVDDAPPYFREAPDYPLTGVGRDVHNVELSKLAELGTAGTALWAAALLAAVLSALRIRLTGELRDWQVCLIAYSVAWLVVAQFVPLSQPFATLLLWVLAGAVHAGADHGAATS